MDSKKIKAELLKKKHRQEALLDNSNNELSELIQETAEVKTKLDSTQTEIDSIKQEINELNEEISTCDHTIEILKSTQQTKHSLIDSLDSDIKTLDTDIFTKLTTLTADYQKAIVGPLHTLKSTCNRITDTVFKPTTVDSKQQLIDLIHTSYDSIIIVNPGKPTQFTIDTTGGISLKNIDTSTRLKGDACGCQNGVFATEYKLQKQVWEDSEKSEYHLIIKLPSKHIDFVSETNPSTINQLDSVRNICPTSRWDTIGNISAKHNLNDISKPCRIDEIESGTVDIISDTKSYELSTDFKGTSMLGKIKFTKLNSRNQIWNMLKEGD